jgi:GT2 family glycosyltransferase
MTENIANRISVVILTYNRADELLRTLKHMYELPEQPQIIVVDNASIDDTPRLVRQEFPNVKLVQLESNIGAAARNAGVQRVNTPYVAFCDDDTWWEPGALQKAVELLNAYPKIAVMSAQILVGEDNRKDPASIVMERSPFPSHDLPGRAVLGFLAGACVFRREAFLQAGGYEPNFFIGGEEALLALDLAVNGWSLIYAPQLLVHHYPSVQRDSSLRRRMLARNAIWVAWMRLSWNSAMRQTCKVLYRSYHKKIFLSTTINVLHGLPWALRNRRVIPRWVESMYRQLQHEA